MNKVEMKEIERNHNIINAIAPISGIEFKKTEFRVGDIFSKVYSLVRYPYKPDVGWLEEILNIPNTISNISPKYPFFMVPPNLSPSQTTSGVLHNLSLMCIISFPFLKSNRMKLFFYSHIILCFILMVNPATVF